MRFRKNRTRKFRSFWRNERRATRRADKWPAWKNNIEVARYVSLLK